MNATDLTEDDYQNAIDLTRNQRLAFAALKRVLKRCADSNIYFYQVLDSLCALNGDNVENVVGSEDFGETDCDVPACLQFKSLPSVETTDSWTDDNHYIVLRSEYFPQQKVQLP